MRWTLSSGRRMAGAASLGLPVAVAALVKALGVGPLASTAAVVGEVPDDEAVQSEDSRTAAPVVLEPLLALPRGAADAWKRADELRHSASSWPSPFYLSPTEAQVPPDQPRPASSAALTTPSFVLNGIMNARPPIAVIDGEIRRAGEALGNGWSIIEIDARRLSVTIRHEDGRTHQLSSQP